MLLFNDCGVIELDKDLCDRNIKSNEVLTLCQTQ